MKLHCQYCGQRLTKAILEKRKADRGRRTVLAAKKRRQRIAKGGSKSLGAPLKFDRSEMILMRNRGAKPKQIAKALGCHVETVYIALRESK